jgi:zinc transport system permease protein
MIVEALGYDFFQNALIAGMLVSIASGIIGSLIVVNRMVFLAGGIAHTSYGGIGLAIYFGIPVFFGATLFSLAAAMLMAYITINNREKLDIYIGLVWSVGMAIGILFIDMTPGYNVDLMSYLFGSILAVSQEDIYYMSALLAIIVLCVIFFYKDLLAVSYDSEYAALRGVNVKFFYTFILMLSALSIVMAIKLVGLILVIALLTIPIYLAIKLSSSLAMMMFLSSLFSILFTFVGLFFSYKFDLTAGATIIMVGACVLIMFLIYEKISTHYLNR